MAPKLRRTDASDRAPNDVSYKGSKQPTQLAPFLCNYDCHRGVKTHRLRHPITAKTKIVEGITDVGQTVVILYTAPSITRQRFAVVVGFEPMYR